MQMDNFLMETCMDDESRLLRRQPRLLKRRYRRTGLALDRLLWVQQEWIRHKANRLKENCYWLACLSKHSGQLRKLWCSLFSVMGLDHVAPATNRGLHKVFWTSSFKRSKLSADLTSGSPPATILSPATSAFQELKAAEVHKFIVSSKLKLYCLDSVLTNILQELLLDLLQFIMAMCYKSRQEGHLLSSQKFVILSTVIKKTGLDTDNDHSY
jgi:hypothetical protein